MRDQQFIRTGLEVGYHVVERAEDIVPAVQTAFEQSRAEADQAKVADKF